MKRVNAPREVVPEVVHVYVTKTVLEMIPFSALHVSTATSSPLQSALFEKAIAESRGTVFFFFCVCVDKN